MKILGYPTYKTPFFLLNSMITYTHKSTKNLKNNFDVCMCIIVKTICKHVNIRVKSEKKVKVFYFQQTKTVDNN